mmetsp:Transcript_44673/g.78586  ORF Transcript_44673/g.78586 Transcript_44673/m.78586 type:complete len:211 (-) Transcript_44673:1281-1913(-)
MDLCILTFVPELGHLHAAEIASRASNLQPRSIQIDIALDQHFCHDGGFCQLAQMEDNTFPLSNEIEILCERFCILDHRMVRAGDLEIDKLITFDCHLASLNTHANTWGQDIVVRQQDLCLSYYEPFPGVPLFVQTIDFSEIEATLHTNYRLLTLTHRELFQVVVGLKHHLTNTGASQPLWFEALLLHRILFPRLRRIHWVQREQWRTALV